MTTQNDHGFVTGQNITIAGSTVAAHNGNKVITKIDNRRFIYTSTEATGDASATTPRAIRADQLVPHGARIRYVQCPQSPFVDSNEQNVCD